MAHISNAETESHEFRVAVVVLCYKSEDALIYAIDSLERQDFREFVVYIIYKQSGEEGNKKLQNCVRKSTLRINVVIQESGLFEEAMNIALKIEDIDILIFMDSDALPSTQFVSSHLSHYSDDSIGGISGRVIQFDSINRNRIELDSVSSGEFQHSVGTTPQESLRRLFSSVEGMDKYVRRISKSGFDYSRSSDIRDSSLVSLGPGANMSVRKSDVSNFEISPRTLFGLRNESQITLELVRRKRLIVYCERAIVYHSFTGESISRGYDGPKRFLIALESSTFVLYLYCKGYISRISLHTMIENVIIHILWQFKYGSKGLWWGIVGTMVGNIIVFRLKKQREFYVRDIEARMYESLFGAPK